MAALMAASTPSTSADEGVAVLAPLSGPFAPIGRNIARTAQSVIDTDVPVVDDGCDAETATAAARDVIASGSKLVIGLPCIDAFDAAAPDLAEAGIAILAVGLQAEDITGTPRGAETWPVFRIGAPATAEFAVLADHVTTYWRDVSFAVIDDGTLYGRQLTENLRLLLSDAALEPVFVDAYRPLLQNQTALVRRLQRAGATHVVIGGEARDAAVIAANAAAIGYPLQLAGGSVLIAPPEDGHLPDGTIIAAIPAEIDLARMAAQIAITAAADPGRAPSESLRTDSFETDWGPITFSEDGEPDFAFFQVHQIRNGRLAPFAPDLDG